MLLLPVQITSVSFDGTKYWQVESDDGATQYSAPQWADANRLAGTSGWDATASNANEHDNAVAYTRNTIPKIGATFKIPGASNWTNLKFKATGPDGISIPATAGTVGGDGITVTAPVTASTTALPNTIKYYNKNDGTSFTLNWSLSVDGGTTWPTITSTKHTVYVTLGDPQTSSNEETIFYLGCENQGTQTDPATVANTIFSEFTSLNVCRVGTTTGMSYWGTWASSGAAQSATPDCFSTAGLLKMGDGRCGAWANFLVDLLSAQGLNTGQVETIDPINIPASGLTGYEILVNNWNLSNLSSPVKLTGVAGQSNPNPQATFSNHALVSFMGTLYDPSYGKKYAAASMSANHQAWEDAALAGIVLQDGSGNLYVQAHTAGTQQTTMSP